MPEDPDAWSARSAFRILSYVPQGSLAKGEALVATGGAARRSPAPSAMVPRCKGLGDVPGIAGHSPITIARQLYYMQTGDRGGAMAALMKAVVDKLDADDILAISAYVASREP